MDALVTWISQQNGKQQQKFTLTREVPYRLIAIGKRVEQLTGTQIARNDKRIKYFFNPIASREFKSESSSEHINRC